eukprot:m51a1_g7212 hypothetical protein (125) ;mRNA; r:228912-229286
MSADRLTSEELCNLVKRVFVPRETDSRLGLMVDLPDARVPDDAAWAARRAMALDWAAQLRAARATLGLGVDVVAYRNAHTNNGDLPQTAWVLSESDPLALPGTAESLDQSKAPHPHLSPATSFN